MTGAILLLALHLQVPGTGVNDTVAWDMAVVDAFGAGVTVFVVCLDGQPTTACARVPETSGVTAAPGTKTYTWKLPALTPGPHRVVIQACTDGAARCSDGLAFAFTFEPTIPNPVNPRLTRTAGGG